MFAQVAPATDALIEVATELLNVVNPVVDVMVICEEPLTTSSPPTLNIFNSLPNAPAFQ